MIEQKEHFHGSDLEKIEKIYGIKKENIVSFAANVNPLGESGKLKTALSERIDAITKYPDREYTSLRKAIGSYCKCDYNHITVGNGCTELISLFIQITAPKKTLLLGPTYSEYERDLRINGRFNSTKPILAFSEETIDISVIEGRSEAGSFVIESTNQIKIRGIVYSTNPRMECLNPHFEGEKVRIRYQFNSKGLVEGDACEGSFVIVCNQIEYSLSFCARITKLYAETSVGVIKNLDDFTKLAKNNWTEAYHLFYNRNFLNILSEDMVVENMIYRGIMAAKPSSRNMEEFLVGVHKKKPVSITVDKTKEEFAASAENQSGSFEITRMNWGYAEIHVRTDCEFIKLSRQALTFDDFIGKTYVYSYIIDNERMHAGNNFGRIIKSVSAFISVFNNIKNKITI